MTLNIGLIAFLLAGPPAVVDPLAQTLPNGAIEIASVQATLIEEVEVPAREKGQLVVLNVREGSIVQAGQELARLDDEQAQVDLLKARAEFDKAAEESENDINERFGKKSEEVAGADLKRAKEAIKQYPNSIQATDMDRISLTWEKAVLQVEQAQRDMKVAKITTRLADVAVKAAEVMIERHRITTPISGKVVDVKKHKGEWVGPGDPVFRIILIEKLRVEGFLSSEQYAGDLEGRTARFFVQLPGRSSEQEFVGEVMFVSPEADSVTGTFRVWAEVENTDLMLRPGLQGRMVIDPPAADPANDTKTSTGAAEPAPAINAPAVDAPASKAPTAAKPKAK